MPKYYTLEMELEKKLIEIINEKFKAEIPNDIREFKAEIRIGKDVINFVIERKLIAEGKNAFLHKALEVIKEFFETIHQDFKCFENYFMIKIYENDEQIVFISALPSWYQIVFVDSALRTTVETKFWNLLPDVLDRIFNEIRSAVKER